MRTAPDIVTHMYYTGIDPFTKEEVYVAGATRDRKLQRAVLQFFKAENWFTMREALIQAGRHNLIDNDCACLIPVQPPNEAVEARRHRADDLDHYHTFTNLVRGAEPGERGLPTKGYRPRRRMARRQDKRRAAEGGSAQA